MERRQFGSTKREVAVIGQGTWYIDSGNRGEAIAALRLGLDLGMTHIDTAKMYGTAEDVVASPIAGRRDEVFLVSKVLPQNASWRGTIAACERSLARLKTDRLDCYLLHWRGQHPLEETIAAFEQLQHQGKILSWGVISSPVAPDLYSKGVVARAVRGVVMGKRLQIEQHLEVEELESRYRNASTHRANSLPNYLAGAIRLT